MTLRAAHFYLFAMLPKNNPEDNFVPRPAPLTAEQSAKEDRLIRVLLLGGVIAAVLGVLLLSLVITVMMSMNFNILNWLE